MVATATAAPAAIEVEIGNKNAGNYYYPPLNSILRGRVELQRLNHETLKSAKSQWGGDTTFPGLVVGFNPDSGRGYVRDPLLDREYAPAKRLIDKYGIGVPLEDEEKYPGNRIPIEGVSGTDILYWLARCVASGNGRVLKGELPSVAELEKQNPRKQFVIEERKSERSQMTEAIKEQTAAIQKQTELFSQLLAKLAK